MPLPEMPVQAPFVKTRRILPALPSNLAFRKTEGKFRYALENRFSDEKYDKNDLGFNQTNNYMEFIGKLSYQIFEPTKTFNNYRFNFFAGYFDASIPNVYTGTWLN